MNSLRRVGPVAVVLAAAIAGGCGLGGKPPAGPAPLAVELGQSAFVGTPLGPTTQASPQFTAASVGLEITWAAVVDLPANALAPLDAQSTLTTSPLAGAPVLTSGRQTRLARFGTNAAADGFRDQVIGVNRTIVGHQVGVVSPGTTARFRCDVGSRSTGRTVILSIARAAATTPSTTTQAATTRSTTATAPAEVGTVTVGLNGFAGEAVEGSVGPAAAVNATESAWLDGVPLSPGDRFAVAVPCDFDAGPWKLLVAYVEVIDAAAARSAMTPATTRPAGPATMPAGRQSLQSAADSLAAAADPRPALLYLASATDAKIAADAAVVANAGSLALLKDAVVKAVTDAPPDAAVPAVGWRIDQATLFTLAAEAEKGTLSPELSAVLVVHAGEVGRQPDAVAEIAKSVGSVADWQARLIGENFIALEDNSASARVRAFDWLTALGRAPAGYDPLADAKARRTAINRALESTGAPR